LYAPAAHRASGHPGQSESAPRRPDAEALPWFRKAGDQGNATAQSALGAMYMDGHGVAQDGAEAVKWYRRAANQGSAAAQFNLGVMERLQARRAAGLPAGAQMVQPCSRAHAGIDDCTGYGRQES
jgi:TPR repeat protein